jgi:uncharacterized protein YjbJ (UPF0337 family)
MNWSQIEGRWQTLTGQLKAQWGKLTDDDLTYIAGKRDQLLGKLQERYGVVKDDADKQIDKWLALVKTQPPSAPVTPEPAAEPAADQRP